LEFPSEFEDRPPAKARGTCVHRIAREDLRRCPLVCRRASFFSSDTSFPSPSGDFVRGGGCAVHRGSSTNKADVAEVETGLCGRLAPAAKTLRPAAPVFIREMFLG